METPPKKVVREEERNVVCKGGEPGQIAPARALLGNQVAPWQARCLSP